MCVCMTCTAVIIKTHNTGYGVGTDQLELMHWSVVVVAPCLHVITLATDAEKIRVDPEERLG